MVMTRKLDQNIWNMRINVRIKPGTMIADRYRIENFIAEGACGQVYKGYHKQLDIEIAIKILKNDFGSHPRVRDRFIREARIMATLRHPNIVRVYDVGEFDNRIYLVMEYIDGVDLERHMNMDVKISLSESIELMTPLSEALSAIHHRGIIHRDIKPSNIMMTKDGNPILMDFGIAKEEINDPNKQGKLTTQGAFLGTPYYMAPEQFSGPEMVTKASDVYALGVTFYQMITHKLPFSGTSLIQIYESHRSVKPAPPHTISKKLSPKVSDILMKMIELDPSKRLEDGNAVKTELRKTQDLQIQGKAGHSIKRKSLSWGLLGVLSFTCIVLAYMVIQQKFREQKLLAMKDKVRQKLLEFPYSVQEPKKVEKDNRKYQKTLQLLDSTFSQGNQAEQSALLAFREGNFQPVVDALQNRKKTAQTTYLLGNLYYMMSNLPLSLQAFENAFELLDGTDAFLHHDILIGAGECYLDLGYCEIAYDYFKQAMDRSREINPIGERRSEIADDWIFLGDTMYCLGKFSESKKCFEKAYAIDTKIYDDDHPVIARDLDRLGGAFDALGDFASAIEHFKKALDIDLFYYDGVTHPSVARDSWHLGSVFYTTGQYQNATKYIRIALEFYQTYYSSGLHSHNSTAWDLLGKAHEGVKEFDQAVECFQKALAIDSQLALTVHDKIFGTKYPEVRRALEKLVSVAADYRDYDQALIEFERVHRNKNIRNNRYSLITRDVSHLGAALVKKREKNDIDRAISLLLTVYKIDKNLDPVNPINLGRDLFFLGKAWLESDRCSEAKTCFESAHDIFKDYFSSKHYIIGLNLEYIGKAWGCLGDVKKANRFLKKALKFYQKSLPPAHPLILGASEELRKLKTRQDLIKIPNFSG